MPARLALPVLPTVMMLLTVDPTRATTVWLVTAAIGATPIADKVVVTEPPAFEAFVPLANVVTTVVEAAPVIVGVNVYAKLEDVGFTVWVGSPRLNVVPVPTKTELPLPNVPRRLLRVPWPDRLPLPVLKTVSLTWVAWPTSA